MRVSLSPCEKTDSIIRTKAPEEQYSLFKEQSYQLGMTSKILLPKETVTCLCLNCVVHIRRQVSTEQQEESAPTQKDLCKLLSEINNKLSCIIAKIDTLENPAKGCCSNRPQTLNLTCKCEQAPF